MEEQESQGWGGPVEANLERHDYMAQTTEMSNRALGPIVLEGNFVRLEPLRRDHGKELLNAIQGLSWDWFLYPLHRKEDVDRRITESLEAEKKDEAYAFAVRLKGSNRVVGSTSYFGIVTRHKRVEIGSTWYTSDVQGTTVNPECKYLLLKHAFEDWGARRIQFTTDINNAHSQRAILKLGAKFEGTLRNHAIRADGSMRDSLVYSILPDEWPAVREGLLVRIHPGEGR
jgi:RimJ/RimL family protein N-acetyltransferase